MSGARVTENNSLEIAKNFQAIAMKATAERTGGRVDGEIERRVRMMNAATTYSSEGTGADGGYAVPPDFRNEIVEKVGGEFSLLPLTNQVVTSSNEVTIPKNEVPCFDNSQGPRVYWKAEAAALTESKIALETTTLRLNKLTALLPITNELVEDAPILYNYLQRAVPQKFIHEFNRVFIEGTGAGEPLGILNAGSLVSVAKETGQALTLLLFTNIVNMVGRMYSPCFNRSVWIVNADVLPQLYQMKFSTATSDQPIFLPPGGASASPYATLFGRPIYTLEAAKTLGDKGDIMLVDWSQYLTAAKAEGLRTDMCIHLFFDMDTSCFKFVWRLAGQPLWRTAITPASGSNNTLSFAVSLDEEGS